MLERWSALLAAFRTLRWEQRRARLGRLRRLLADFDVVRQQTGER